MTNSKGISSQIPDIWNENVILLEGEKKLVAGKYDDSLDEFKKIPEESANFPRACKGMGSALLRLNRLSEALKYLQTAHQAFPTDPIPLLDGADVVRLMGNLEVAEDTYSEARKLGADSYQLYFGETAILESRKLWLRAMQGWRTILDRFPENATVLHNLGKAYHELGETDKAVEHFRRALEMEDRLPTIVSLATIAPHASCCDHSDVWDIRTRLNDHLAESEEKSLVALPNLRSEGKIRIGYVSAFFHRRNWMKPVWALLNHHDRERFEIHLFADGPTDKIVAEGGYEYDERDRLHDTRKLANSKLADLVRKNEIDVLVDLNSYSATGRLGLWTEKPAPISIGWFNLYATSGMAGLDWLIGDNVVIRENEEEYYTEKILRLNQSYLTFQVGYKTPDIGYPKKSNVFTFGCLGSAYKITPEVRASWVKLLQSTSDTRLIVRNRLFGEEEHLNWFREYFVGEGISSERVKLLGPAPHHEFLSTYGEIDLALDTFPYNGGTTTMESLWQGVPIVCFNGDRWISRTSATLMDGAGLGHFIGENVDEYIKIAADWSAGDRRDELTTLRGEMRDTLRSSSVSDGQGLANDFERIVDEIFNQT